MNELQEEEVLPGKKILTMKSRYKVLKKTKKKTITKIVIEINTHVTIKAAMKTLCDNLSWG